MHSRDPLKIWVGIIATGMWAGAAGAAVIGWLVSRMRESGSTGDS